MTTEEARMTTYATPEDYYEFTGREVPATGIPSAEATLLRSRLSTASDDVQFYLRFTGTRLHPTGFPSEPVKATAVKRATCAQAKWYSITDDETGAESRFDSVATSQAGVSVSKSRRAGSAGESSGPADSRVAPQALIILTNAGITPGQIRRSNG